MGHETELKFVGPEDAVARLRASPALLAFSKVEHARTRALKATYFDTDDLALRKAGYVLRVRDEGGRFVQTVKTVNGASVATRTEIKSIVRKRRPNIKTIDDDGVRAAVAEILRRRKLKPVFESETRRTTMRVMGDAGAEIEVAFDDGAIMCGEAKLPIHEVELELLRGAPAALVDCARILMTGSELVLSLQSKSERGYIALQGAGLKPVAAERVHLPARPTADEAFGTIVSHCLRHMTGNWAAVVEARDAEGVHQMRVALRRLRSALALFAAPFRPALAPLEEEVRWVAGVLGRARDLDVLLEEVFMPAAEAHGDDPRLGALADLARERQAMAWDELLSALGSERFRRLVFETSAATMTRPWTQAASGGGEALVPAADFARERLAARYVRVRKIGRRIGKLNETERHALRIKLKKLRYAVDFFASLWPKRRTEAFRERLSDLQDVLGQMNDAAVARALVGDILAARTNAADAQAIAYAAGVVVGWHVGHLRDRVEKLENRWQAFIDAKPPWTR
jgi:triphosphatase